ncbi:hypothetical protein M067_4946 [Bacteroides fragilis str. J-143-4]|uniref:hypothetical protein n=1 Tax=Bacteroides fragilis TaxID=817 RepID=UPI0004534BC1|nr:hypothetical protein [Bacteroides fragilis]EXZ16684.1 hypothetical protein M067_4946 [Bacteroides fragilis str. J-143-4]
MTEELVTLDTAKLLKEKGFDEPCSIAINIEDGRKYISNRTNSEMPRKVCTQPTQSIAHKWLRETKNIHICVYNCACGYGYEIYKADNGTHIASSTYKGTNDGGKWNTYEESLEAGIKECLKLI